MTCSAAAWGLAPAVSGMEGCYALDGISGDEAILYQPALQGSHNRTETWEPHGLDSTPTRSVSAVCGAAAVTLMR